MTNPLDVSVNPTPVLAEISALDYGQGLGDRAEPRDRAGGGSGGGGGSASATFTADDVGGLPAGWVENSVRGSQTATVEALADSFSGYALQVTTAEDNSIANYVNTNVGPFTRGQVLALVRWTNALAGSGFRFPGTGLSYMCDVTGGEGGGCGQRGSSATVCGWSQSDFWNSPHAVTVGITGGPSTTTKTFTEGQRVYVRIYYDTTTDEYKARFWAVGDAEPGTWDLDRTSAQQTTGLTIGGTSGYYGWGFIEGDTPTGTVLACEWIEGNNDPTVDIAVPE